MPCGARLTSRPCLSYWSCNSSRPRCTSCSYTCWASCASRTNTSWSSRSCRSYRPRCSGYACASWAGRACCTCKRWASWARKGCTGWPRCTSCSYACGSCLTNWTGSTRRASSTCNPLRPCGSCRTLRTCWAGYALRSGCTCSSSSSRISLWSSCASNSYRSLRTCSSYRTRYTLWACCSSYPLYSLYALNTLRAGWSSLSG